MTETVVVYSNYSQLYYNYPNKTDYIFFLYTHSIAFTISKTNSLVKVVTMIQG